MNLAIQSMKDVWKMFPGIFGDIPRNVSWHFIYFIYLLYLTLVYKIVLRHSAECLAAFPGMFGDIPRNVWGHSPECLGHSPECLATFPHSPHSVPQSCISVFIHSHFRRKFAAPTFIKKEIFSTFYITIRMCDDIWG